MLTTRLPVHGGRGRQIRTTEGAVDHCTLLSEAEERPRQWGGGGGGGALVRVAIPGGALRIVQWQTELHFSPPFAHLSLL